ncbi:MAG: RNA methyltransferase [Treponema sp.]|jgi:tRNA/rRNA methyltransferase/tRNA (cytidine32/uridine32-2'-O)-methyltransferase|nr:RNA methyltransferase [Treponema sp.]
MNLEDTLIILARPSEPGNIGAVCRAMKNMGLSRLRLVAPQIPGPDKPVLPLSAGEVIRARAVHAVDIWEKAECFAALEEAVADCALVIGVTRRMGSRRKAWSLTPAETASRLGNHPGPAALVFGNERTGLEDREIRLCNLTSHIPAADAFPSLNLSHAVQIYAYELFRTLAPVPTGLGGTADKAPGRWVPLDQANLEALSHSVSNSLAFLGFYKQPGREDQEHFFRDVFSRAGLTQREGQYISDIFAKAARLAKKKTEGD